MHADLLLVLLVIVFGCAAFLFGLVYIVGSLVGAIGRGFWGLLRPTRRSTGGCASGTPEAARRRAHVCPSCRNVEVRTARFCPRCGAKRGVNDEARRARDESWWWTG